MPQMADPRFARTVVYLCAHSAEGAMGLVVNRLIDSLSFGSLLAQLGVEAEGAPADMPVHFGGPVESSRGFVLHTSDYQQDSTLVIDDEIAPSASTPSWASRLPKLRLSINRLTTRPMAPSAEWAHR